MQEKESDVRLCFAPYSDSCRDELVSVANAAFGDGYITPEKLAEYFSHPHVCRVALCGERLVGYCFFILEDAPRTCELIHISRPELDTLCGSADEGLYCHMKSMSVLPEYRRSGAADRLFAECLEGSAALGAHFAIGTAWKIGDRVPMRRIFAQHGFEIYKEIPMIWYEDKEYHCVVCGGPCRCTGVVYYKRI